MRLAVVSPFIDRRHGTERALAELLERLACTYHCEIHLYSQRVEGLALSESSNQEAMQGGIVWHKVSGIRGPQLLQFVFWLFLNSVRRTWDRRTKGLSFDLVFSPGINCFDADAVIVHALFHRLCELRGDKAKPLARSGWFRRLHRRAYHSFLARLERRIYSGSRVSLATVSSRTASLLSHYFDRDDVRVIPHGVDAAQFSPSKRLELREEVRSRFKFRKNDFVLLLIGNDWGNKGLSTVLDAMADLRETPVRLLVAGQDAAASFFFAAAERVGLSQQCRWKAVLADPINLYAAADAYVSPTREDSFGLPVLEAMACGLPVITSIFAGASQIITDGVDGFVLKDPSDAPALAGLLGDLHADADLRIRIGEAARRTAEGYTWDRNAAAAWEFLNEVASKKQSSHGRR